MHYVRIVVELYPFLHESATFCKACSILVYSTSIFNCSQYALNDDGTPGFLFSLTIWVYSFMLKLIPSIVLTIFTGFLIHELYKAEERSARLKNGAGVVTQTRTPQGPQVLEKLNQSKYHKSTKAIFRDI